jgi:hypothetical protein
MSQLPIRMDGFRKFQRIFPVRLPMEMGNRESEVSHSIFLPFFNSPHSSLPNPSFISLSIASAARFIQIHIRSPALIHDRTQTSGERIQIQINFLPK